MLVKDQYAEIRWNNFTKRWYTNKGYSYTKNNDVFMVDVKDLTKGSGIKVSVKCDYCGGVVSIPFHSYLKNTKDETRKFACTHCSGKKYLEYTYDNTKGYNKFCKLCKKNGYEVISPKSDYRGIQTKLKFRCPSHGVQEMIFSNMEKGHKCNLCGIEEARKKMIKPKSEVISAVEGKNGNILLNPDEYIGSGKKNLRVICGSCKEEFITSLASITVTEGACKKCGHEKLRNIKRFSPNEVKDMINSINGNILLNPDEYVNCYEKSFG